MRIWDINPGYLNRQSLEREFREIHEIVSLIENHQAGYTKHPETSRWLHYGWALGQRHRLLTAEMSLRGYETSASVTLEHNIEQWPTTFIDTPGQQLSILADHYKNLPQGRIPLPKNVQQLWAQHKYSVMARDPSEYQRMGNWVAGRNSGNAMHDLHRELVLLLRRTPDAGNLQNAVQHMWGYVSRFTSNSGAAIKGKTIPALLGEIQRLALLHDVVYLKESTALSDLQAWQNL